MTDKRELILARLLGISQGLPGITAAFRNKDEISDRQRPCIVILDADEAADDGDPSGLARRPQRPATGRHDAGDLPDAGGQARRCRHRHQRLRAAFIKAVLMDSGAGHHCRQQWRHSLRGLCHGSCPRPQHGGRDGSLLHLLLHPAAGRALTASSFFLPSRPLGKA